jgi:hypothetical protein
MRQRDRLILAAFFLFLGLPLCQADGTAEADSAPMARAALPPPLRATPSGSDRQQPPPSQTGSPGHDATASGSYVINPSEFFSRSSKHAHGAITSAYPRSAFSRKPRALAIQHNSHRHLHRTHFAAVRGTKHMKRLPGSGPSPDPEYGDPPAASPAAMAPVAPPPPLFRYPPPVPPGYVYLPEYQPPWLPGPSPPR